jgi:hypothetical protein
MARNLSQCNGTGCGVVFQLTPNADGSWAGPPTPNQRLPRISALRLAVKITLFRDSSALARTAAEEKLQSTRVPDCLGEGQVIRKIPSACTSRLWISR